MQLDYSIEVSHVIKHIFATFRIASNQSNFNVINISITMLFVDEVIEPKSHEMIESILREHIDFIDKNSRLEFNVISNGITNYLVSVGCKSGEKKNKIMVRIYGKNTECFIDREMELKILNNARIRKQTNCRIYLKFKNGICYSFVKGRSLTSNDVTDYFNKIVDVISSFHGTKYQEFMNLFTEPYINTMFKRLICLLLKAETADSSVSTGAPGAPATPMLNYDNKSSSSSSSSSSSLTSSTFMSEFDWLNKQIISATFRDNLVLCHNDLLPSNLIYDSKQDQLCLIDFEYSGPNYALFDIANYFCECLINHPNEYGLYPSLEYQQLFLQKYHENMTSLNESSSDKVLISQRVDKDLKHLHYFIMMSHLFWSLWATVQYYISEITFDYKLYAQTRIDQYFIVKNTI